MKKLPIGIQTFSKIIEEDYLYIDKTQYIYKLINGVKNIFLSRPRRFGKSLLLDTIGEAFNGSKELFKGLWIYDSDYSFQKHPVIRLDMSSIANENPETLKISIISNLKNRIKNENLNITEKLPSDMFIRLIEGLYKKYNQRVVVLIDEYDKPILDHINDIKTADANRQVIRSFYGVLKSMDPYLNFTFITGVTKFAKTSIFSGLNNFKDITMLKEYANICGVPVENLDQYFNDYIANLSGNKRFDYCGNLREEILRWYDGYSWDGRTKLLNPFSLLNFFDQKKFHGYWYSSGALGFLLDLIKRSPEAYSNIMNYEITESMLDSVEIENMTLEPLLFQTGYLTIKDIPLTADEPVYLLDTPNNEVKKAFNLQIVSALTEKDDVRAGRMRNDINKALQVGDLRKMLDVLRGFFASIPYNLYIDREAYYHSIFYALTSALGFNTNVEFPVSRGRVDAILELDNIVYVMEFKYKKCPPDANDELKRTLSESALDEAITQINDRDYAAKYAGSGKTIYKAAFAFLGGDNIEMRSEKQNIE